MKLNKLLFEMAYTRAVYKDELESYLIGAILHFYKVEYAKLNNQTRWIEHWSAEYEQQLKLFKKHILHTTRGFRNRRKAALEVLAIVKQEDNNYRRAVQNEVNRDFNQKFRKPITNIAIKQIHQTILNIINDALPEKP